MSEQLPVTITMKKVNGELVLQGTSKTRLEMFADSLPEGELLEVTYEPVHGNASYAQLSKLHKCIRVIADETGDNFQSVKDEVKRRAGLYTKLEHLKSFGGASKEEVSKAIEAVMELAEFLNVNLY